MAALTAAGVSHNVIMELPLGAPTRPEHEEVRECVAEARRAFERGGALGWRGCAGAIRHALDAWEQVSAAPVRPIDQAQLLHERVGLLRRSLRNITHLAHDGPAEPWTRGDALLLLATATALLSRDGG